MAGPQQISALKHQQTPTLPHLNEPLIDSETGYVSVAWYKFFQALALGLTNAVTLGVTATGTRQLTATQLIPGWTLVTTVPPGTGVLLPPPSVGGETKVWNLGANALLVYPAVGTQIDSLGPNNPYSLAPGKTQEFSFTSTTQAQSEQLG